MTTVSTTTTQTLEGEATSLRAELQDRYASASEQLQALSAEKRTAEAACADLRARASALEERRATVTTELKVDR